MRQLAWGVLGGAVSVCLTFWLRFYIPETDSFADIRDLPAILLAFFVGPVPALIAGAIAAVGRMLIGLFSGIGSATWFASSAATLGATVLAVVARRHVFRETRPSVALGATMAAIVEMFHMAIVLIIGCADFSNVFAVILKAIPFQCGGAATVIAVASILFNRRQNGRENLSVGALVVTVVTFEILVYFAMEHQAQDMADGLIPLTDDLRLYSCHLATVLYGIVLSVLVFVFVVYVKHGEKTRSVNARRDASGNGSFHISLRGKLAISLSAMLGIIGGLVTWLFAVDSRMQYERGYAETALYVAEFLSKYIDGEKVRRYHEDGRKDGYYEEVEKLLKQVRGNSEIQYLFVAVPVENGMVYVWDTGEDDLGVRDDDFESDELSVGSAAMRGEFDKGYFIHRSEKYGHLMSAVVPILGADGRPVALTWVEMSMDYVDGQINRIVFGAGLVTLTLVLVCLAGYYFFVSRFIVSPAERQLKAEEDRIHAELNVARKIQLDALPNVFPAFPDHREFDIYGMMDPAKEVGGDFYDFFLVDDSHLAVVIGDASDKGVPAALFIMTTKTLVRARTQRGGTPAEILRDVNDRLCEGNSSAMFVTLYLAIIDLKTGEAMAANAGHEHPALRRKDGEFELVKYAHDPMLGMMPGLSYSDRSFRLSPGDTLLIYTDGVTEAKNAEGIRFGADRITEALNRIRWTDVRTLLTAVREEVGSFVGAAPQFDDITLLAVTYKGDYDIITEKE